MVTSAKGKKIFGLFQEKNMGSGSGMDEGITRWALNPHQQVIFS